MQYSDFTTSTNQLNLNYSPYNDGRMIPDGVNYISNGQYIHSGFSENGGASRETMSGFLNQDTRIIKSMQVMSTQTLKDVGPVSSSTIKAGDILFQLDPRVFKTEKMNKHLIIMNLYEINKFVIENIEALTGTEEPVVEKLGGYYMGGYMNAFGYAIGDKIPTEELDNERRVKKYDFRFLLPFARFKYEVFKLVGIPDVYSEKMTTHISDFTSFGGLSGNIGKQSMQTQTMSRKVTLNVIQRGMTEVKIMIPYTEKEKKDLTSRNTFLWVEFKDMNGKKSPSVELRISKYYDQIFDGALSTHPTSLYLGRIYGYIGKPSIMDYSPQNYKTPTEDPSGLGESDMGLYSKYYVVNAQIGFKQ